MVQEGEKLACLKCGGTDGFMALVTLQWKPGGGVVPVPAGYVCSQCQTPADTAEMVLRAKLKRGWNPNEGE
jgi:hypothetical protein